MFIKELHKQLFGKVWKWAGSFRLTGKNVGVDSIYIAVELKNLLDDTNYWIENETYSREEFAARFHHRLVFIHPFPNGNGRHARIMTDVLLEKCLNLKPINWSADKLISNGNHRLNYIQALREADKKNYQLLINFISK